MSAGIHRIWDSMDTANKAVTIGSLAILALVLLSALIIGMRASYKQSEAQARLRIGLMLNEYGKRPGRK